MVIDSCSTRKSKDDTVSKKSRKNPEKTVSSSLRRSTRGTTLKEQVTSNSLAMETPPEKESISIHSSKRKSERLEKKEIALPVEKNSEILEREMMSSNPLRRSDRGKAQKLQASPDLNKYRNLTASLDVKKKKLREKCVKQLTVEAMETSESEKQVKRPNGRIKKKMSGYNYKVCFSQRKRKNSAPDLGEDLEKPDLGEDREKRELCFQGDVTSVGVNVSNPIEDEADGIKEYSENFEKECIGRDCEEKKDQPVFTANNANALTLSKEGELETSSFKLCSSMQALGKLSQENGVNSLNGSTIIEEIIDDSKRLLVDQVLVVELPTPEVVRLPDSNFVEETCPVSHPSPVLEDDNIVGTFASCRKRRRLNYDSPSKELCFCSIAPTNDLLETSRTEDRVELAPCDDSLNDSLNDANLSTCAICKLDENLLCCDGKDCKQSYHRSCLDISFDYGLPGVWHCFSCVKKKIEYGVHSVSLEIEAIWDAREVEVQDDKGLQMERQFFVKYKGLSHFHNQWLPESQLLFESSTLISDFDEQKQDSKWRQEWIVPHRILKKRLLWSPNHRDNSNNDTSSCKYEFLIKWSGLEYEDATWELENASFFQSPEFQSLFEELENHRKRAKEASPLSSPEKCKKQSVIKFSKLPAGCSPVDDHNQQASLDKLFEFWSKGHDAIVVEDERRLSNLILFIVSLVSDVSQPFLIISSPSTLSVWEAEFSRLAPFINVVIYSGNRENRKIIRNTEFYTDRNRTMLQVLLSSVEAVVEDIDVILPKWEAVIFDECQDTWISKHFERIRTLTTTMKILLFNSQLKESTSEYINLLSLVDSPKNLTTNSGLKSCELREKLSPYIAYDCSPDISRFHEYWVPVSISNVQLEQYCATLLSNFTTLRSSSFKYTAGALHDILISTKKCCDHPYLVDLGLQGFLTKDLPPVDYLDVGIKASGKLQLLDIVLSETKSRGKKVLILYQSIRSAGILTGNILDDFLRQKFGIDSYERVDGGIILSKKQAAIKKFNDKGSGRFVFLLEKRACSPTVKLASVDAVVIFDSDWNVINDNKALHRLSIDSYSEPIKVFRLYTSGTMEEKVLDLATNHVSLDSNLENVKSTTSHMLLMWGASHLFRKLDEFHSKNASNGRASLCSDILMIKDVARELLQIVILNVENSFKNSLITKVRQTGVGYSKNTPLFGQLKGQLTNGKEPHLFWSELLDFKSPCWIFLPVHSQQKRKRVQNYNELSEKSHDEPEDVTKKRKKIVNSSAAAAFLRSRQKEVPLADLVEGKKLGDLQKNLHGLLLPAILKLSKVLQISEDTKTMGGIFLDYIINNRQISSEPESILQAFQISLIWTAASLLSYELDKKQSLDLAKQKLGFCCTEKEATQDKCSMPSTSAGTLDGDSIRNTNHSQQAGVKHPTSAEATKDECSRPSPSAKILDGDSRAHETYNATDPIEDGPSFSLPNPELTNHLPYMEQAPSQNREQFIMQNGENLLQAIPSQVVHETRPLYSDPLQIEFEQLNKDIEEAKKLHEDAKLQFRSEYEEELAEICRKYEAKLKVAEADYLLRKEERDAFQEKVFMNRLLAEAFLKGHELKPSVSSGMYQVGSTNFLPQLFRLSSQSLNTSANSNFPNINPLVANQQNTVPSVSAPQHSPPIIPNIQMRLHRTFPITRHTGYFSASGEMRAPAPHLRPSSSTSAPSIIPLANHGSPHQDPQRHAPYSTAAQVPPHLQVQKDYENMGFSNISVAVASPPKVLPSASNLGSKSDDVVYLSDDE